MQEVEKQGFDSVKKVQNQNEELEREKLQLERQLKALNAELDQQKVAQQRLGLNFTYFFLSNENSICLFLREVFFLVIVLNFLDNYLENVAT